MKISLALNTTQSEAGESSLSRHIIMMWLLGAFVALPVRFINFPLNLELVDLCIFAALPIFWLSFILGRQTIIANSSYAVAILIILVASLASTFAAPNPTGSLIVVLKEIYLFVWFVTMTTLLARLSDRDFRLVMFVWLAVVVLHGILILAQFIWPDLYRLTSGLGGKSVIFDHFRPSGLFMSEKAGSANKAAFFQLLGFVPLVLARPSKGMATVFGIVLLASILLTGSMGTTIAFTAGLLVAVVAIAALGKLVVFIRNYFVRSVIALSFLGGILFFVISNNRSYQDHFESLIVGRADRSSEGRFYLWQRGLEVLLDRNVFMWGVGPENFRVVDEQAKQLHNDLLAFGVERGLLGALGLVILGAIATSRAFYMLQMYRKCPQRTGLVVVVFLAAIVAMLVASLTHQVFHSRELWLVLASQEAMLFKMTVVHHDEYSPG